MKGRMHLSGQHREPLCRKCLLYVWPARQRGSSQLLGCQVSCCRTHQDIVQRVGPLWRACQRRRFWTYCNTVRVLCYVPKVNVRSAQSLIIMCCCCCCCPSLTAAKEKGETIEIDGKKVTLGIPAGKGNHAGVPTSGPAAFPSIPLAREGSPDEAAAAVLL